MHQRVIISLLLAALVACASACGASRTAAATQKTPAAFDPATSEPKAVEVVDAMMTALGGAETWSQVKQLQWDVKYRINGELRGWFKHSWDIWNGRHRYEFATEDQINLPKPVFTFAMYDLFNRDKGYVARTDKPNARADKDATARIVAAAYDSWKRDAYQLAMFFKLRDPGVKLQYAGERQDFMGLCKPSCHDIKVSYVPEVGSDTYHVLINTQSNLPEAIEKYVDSGKLAYQVAEWQQAGGLNFPTLFKNLGTDEQFTISDIRIGEPDDELYVPQVVG